MLLETYTRKSKIYNLHPAYKVGMFVFYIVLLQFNESVLYALLLCGGMSALSLSLNAIRPWQHCKLMLYSVFALSLSVLPLLIIDGLPANEFSMQEINFHSAKLHRVTILVLESWCLFSALLLLILSTPIHQLLFLMRKMRFPETILELVNLIYRNVFIMLSLAHEIWLSQQTRLGYVNWRVSIRSFSQLLVSVLLLSIRRGEDQYNSLNARCYSGTWRELPTSFEIGGKYSFVFGIFLCCSSLLLWTSNSLGWA